jgi:hypothetical protein
MRFAFAIFWIIRAVPLLMGAPLTNSPGDEAPIDGGSVGSRDPSELPDSSLTPTEIGTGVLSDSAIAQIVQEIGELQSVGALAGFRAGDSFCGRVKSGVCEGLFARNGV